MAQSVRPDGQRVRALREERGWSQEGLADRALVDVQTLRRVERSEPVRRVSLVKLARALAQPVTQLEAEVADPAPPPSPVDRLRTAVAADCGSANLLAGIAQSPARPLREYAVGRTLALGPALPGEPPRRLLRPSAADGVGRWIVVGDAGAGKTTLLQALAHELASDDDAELCPVVIRLGELAQEPLSPQDPASLLASAGQDRDLLVEQAARGSLVLLLDGLDEVAPLRREQMRSLLKVVAATWPCPIVATSRPQGLRCPGGFELATLNPLSEAQVADFLRRWPSAAGMDWIPALEEERRNPLLLTLAALLHERRADGAAGAWPATRYQLLEQVVLLLLEGLHRPEASPRLTDLDAAADALELIAHAFTAEGVVAEPRAALGRRLRDDEALWRRLERVPRWSAGPEEFLTELAERSGLLGQHDGQGSPWRFWHRSLQELLTARYLAARARKDEGRAARLVEEARGVRRGGERSQWVEPFTLLCGALPRPDELLLALADGDPEVAARALECARTAEPATLRALARATRPLEDARPRARTFVEGMRNWWAVVGDSARPGLVKAIEYRIGAWVGDDAAARRLLGELSAALGRERVDPLEVGAALDALARQLPCFRGPLRGAVYLQAGRLLPRDQARALALELWDAALARGSEIAEDLYFLDELLRRLDGGRADAGSALYERLAPPTAVAIDWRAIPAGEVLLGSPPAEGGFPWEQPRLRARFPSPWEAAATQVTNGQYSAFDPSLRPPDGVHADAWRAQPAIDVSWYGAVAFCRWLARAGGGAGPVRLPTEAEWEYMARAGTTTAYWSGDAEADLARVGWYRGNSGGHVHAVGQRPPNPWGLHDVHGNVWEWVQDWYGPYDDATAVRPTGPKYGACRVLRGGCFAWDAPWARSAHRSWLPPEAKADDVGFRLVRAAP